MDYSHLTNYSFVDSENVLHQHLYDYCEQRHNIRVVVNGREDFIKQLETYTIPMTYTLPHYEMQIVMVDETTLQNEFRTDSNENIEIFKNAVCLMYSQNPDAFTQFVEKYNQNVHLFNEQMQAFYGDIIESQNAILK
jgi:hypothetical protein